MRAAFIQRGSKRFEAAKSYKANKADWFAGRWSGLHMPADPESARRNVATGVEGQIVRQHRPHDDHIPDTLEVHKTLRRVIDARARCSPQRM